MDVTQIPVFELLRGEVIRSDEFTFRRRPMRFRLLDQREISWCRAAAQKRVLTELLEVFEGDRDTALRLMHQGPNIDSQNDWAEIYMIAGALCESSSGAPFANDSTPHGAADTVADAINPFERRALIEQYLAFAAEHDPAGMTAEQLNDLVGEVKKNGESSLKLSAVSSLRNFAVTLVTRLAEQETEIRALQARVPMAEISESLEARISALEAKLFLIPASSPGS